MDEVFSLSRGPSERDSRVLKVGGKAEMIRVRSIPLWAHLHWQDRSILCAGKECPACQRGYTRRRYAFVAVDLRGGLLSTIQLTEGDVCTLTRLEPSKPDSMTIGSQFRVWREGSRRPMVADYCGFTPDLVTISFERLMVDVLRIHGVAATERDVSSGGHRQLAASRCWDLIGGQRAMA